MFNKRHYEPKTIKDIIVDDPVTHQRLTDYANGIRTDHVLMHGPPGTAKSTAASVIAETRINASGSQLGGLIGPYEGVNFTENHLHKIEREWSIQRIGGVGTPVTVVNEIDKMPLAMREKLKAFMDQQRDNGQIIATTNNHLIFSDAMRNRFDEIPMPNLSNEKLKERAREILEAEGIKIDENVLDELVNVSNGNWRELQSIVQDIVIEYKREA